MPKPKRKSKTKPQPKAAPEAKAAPVPSAGPEPAKGPLVIDVPKTDPGAFNPDRPAGKLLQSQCAHLREALIRHLHQVTALAATDIRSLKTEGQISDYIHRVTSVLHPRGGPGEKR
jgi:hypothetical protein